MLTIHLPSTWSLGRPTVERLPANGGAAGEIGARRM